MSTRTKYQVQCPCGHTGTIIMRESDAPYSGQWEEYSLNGLNGQSFKTTLADWDEVFKAMEPVCPTCGSNLKPADLVNS